MSNKSHKKFHNIFASRVNAWKYGWCATFRSLLFLQVKYTQGGLENLELSRKYFAQALKLNNRNMRALFGLYMVSLGFFFFFPLHVNILYALMHVYHPSAFAVFSSFWFNIVFNNNVNNLNYRVWTALCQWSTVIEKIIIKASFCIPVCVSWFPMPGGVMILH